jgi:hypothetical protein
VGFETSMPASERPKTHVLMYAYRVGRCRFRFRKSRQSTQKNVICLSVRVRIVVADAGGSVQTVWVRRFTGMISSFLFRLSESGSEPESVCTILVPLQCPAFGVGSFGNTGKLKAIYKKCIASYIQQVIHINEICNDKWFCLLKQKTLIRLIWWLSGIQNINAVQRSPTSHTHNVMCGCVCVSYVMRGCAYV